MNRAANIRTSLSFSTELPLVSPRVKRIFSKGRGDLLTRAVSVSRREIGEVPLLEIKNEFEEGYNLEGIAEYFDFQFFYSKQTKEYLEGVLERGRDEFIFPKLRKFYRETLEFKKNYDSKE